MVKTIDNSAEPTFRETLQEQLTNPDNNAILIGENHNQTFVPEAILANMDLFEQSGREVIFIVEQLEQGGNSSSAARNEDIANQDLAFRDAMLYQTLESHGVRVLGAENAQSSPLYGLKGDERRAKLADAQKFTSSMDRIKTGNQVFSDLINSTIQNNPGAVVVFVGGATHCVELTTANDSDIGMMGRVDNASSVLLNRTDAKQDNVSRNAEYLQEGDASKGKGTYDIKIDSSKQNIYNNMFARQPTPADQYDKLKGLVSDAVKAYANYHKSARMDMKMMFGDITDAFKQANNLPPNAEFPNLQTLMQKVVGDGGSKPDIKFDSKMQKAIDKALQQDIKAISPDLHREITKSQAARNSAPKQGKPGAKSGLKSMAHMFKTLSGKSKAVEALRNFIKDKHQHGDKTANTKTAPASASPSTPEIKQKEPEVEQEQSSSATSSKRSR